MRLREGLDVNALGSSLETPQRPSASGSSGSSSNKLVVVPPTPEHGEEDMRRRQNNVFRHHPGAVASTPDLRKKGKEKEKEGRGERRDEGAPPAFLSPGAAMQGADGKRLRGSSSTSSFSMVSASSVMMSRTPVKDENGRHTAGEGVSPGPDWGATSPRARSGSKVRFIGFAHRTYFLSSREKRRCVCVPRRSLER